MDFLPGWSTPSNVSLGRDPLGIQATSVRIYRSLIPGLTNVTNRLRYYSFYCWVVRLFEIQEHSDDERRWRVFIRRAEALYAYASILVDPEESDGLAGSIWAKARVDARQRRLQIASFTDDARKPGQYLKAKAGNFGQFYLRSMIEIGLLQESSGVPLVTESRGVEMAEAFAEAIGEDVERRIRRVLKSGVVNLTDAQLIGNSIRPAAIEAASNEMKLLRDFLLTRTPDALGDGTHRRRTAWLLLDLIRKGVDLGNESQVRRAFYHRLLPSGKSYTGGGETIDRWRVYQANELCHIALELWLNAIARNIDQPGNRSPREIIGGLIDGVFSASECSTSWESWAGTAGKLTASAEDEIAESILGALRKYAVKEDGKTLKDAVRLLASVWRKWSGGAEGVKEELDRFAGINGRSLAKVLEMFAALASRDSRTALTDVFQEQIIVSHLRIAARKLGAGGKFTYRFAFFDGVLTDGVLTEYGYTTPRIENLSRFLRDAKLCVGNSLTAAGRRFLDEAAQ